MYERDQVVIANIEVRLLYKTPQAHLSVQTGFTLTRAHNNRLYTPLSMFEQPQRGGASKNSQITSGCFAFGESGNRMWVVQLKVECTSDVVDKLIIAFYICT